MIFVQHPTNNHALGAPPDWNIADINDPRYCHVLPVTLCKIEDKDAIVSFWKPSEEEIANILAGLPVMLIVYGRGHPVVALGVAEK